MTDTDLPRITVIRAVIRVSATTPGTRWDTVIVGWLNDRLTCDAHPHARRCEHIDHVRRAITEGTKPQPQDSECTSSTPPTRTRGRQTGTSNVR